MGEAAAVEAAIVPEGERAQFGEIREERELVVGEGGGVGGDLDDVAALLVHADGRHGCRAGFPAQARDVQLH